MMDKEKTFYELIKTLYETSRLLNSYENIPRKYGTEEELYTIEAHTLKLIGEKIKTTTTEIAEINNRTKSAVSQIVDKLIKKDLIIKYRNPENYRELNIELTPKGHLVYDYHKKLDQQEYGNYLKSLEHYSAEDFEKYNGILNIIKHRLLNLIKDMG